MIEKQVPPHNTEIEDSIIGLLLVDSYILTEYMTKLSTEFFYNTAHRNIFQSIQDLFDKGRHIDVITITNDLRVKGKLEPSGGAYAISMMVSSVSSSAHIDTWLAILMQYYMQRQGIKIGQKLVSDSFNLEDSECLNLASNSILQVQESVFKNTEKSINHFIKELAIQREKSSLNGQIGIDTGYKNLNDIISGWVAPDLTILAARPAQGKTAFMLNSIMNVLNQNLAVGVFSLEMSGEQLVNRLISLDTGIAHSNLRHNTLDATERQRLANSEVKLAQTKLHIDDSPSLNIRELRSKATIMKRKYDIQFLCIDYLQLMSGTAKNGTRETEISEISRGCKIIAKELNIPVLALSQLSRAVESRGDKMPQLSDLRESGSIEQDADSVIFIMRPETYGIKEIEIKGNTISSEDMCVVKIGKNRHGEIKNLPFQFKGETMSFKEYIY